MATKKPVVVLLRTGRALALGKLQEIPIELWIHRGVLGARGEAWGERGVGGSGCPFVFLSFLFWRDEGQKSKCVYGYRG